MTGRERNILLLTVVAHALVHIFDGMIAPLIPLLVREFNTDFFRVGIVVSMFSILFGAGALPAGLIADRLGPRRLISAYLIGAGALFLAVGAAGGLWVYGALMAGAGLFCSTYHPAANTLIGKEIAERGNAFGIHGIAGSLGTAAAPVIVAWLGSRAGWRAPHMMFGAIAVGVGLISLRLPVRAPDVVRSRVAGPLKSYAPVLSLVAFYLAAGILGLAYRGTMTFLPAFMGERIVVAGVDSVTTGGMMATLTLLSGAVGQYVGGRLTDRMAPEPLYVIALVVSTVFLFLVLVGTPVLLVISAAIFALFYFAVQPIQNDILARYVAPDSLGAAYGLHFLVVFGAGAFAGAGGGYLADRFGLAAVFVATLVCFVIATALIVVVTALRGRVEVPAE